MENSIIQDYEQQLLIHHWLSRAGDKEKDISSPFLIEPVISQSKMYRLLKSINWVNIDVIARNKLSAQVDHFCAKGQLPQVEKIWDKLVDEGHRLFGQYEQILQVQADSKGLKQEVLTNLKEILLAALLEYYFSRQIPQLNIDFCSNLLKIVNQGYVPCGWSVNPPDDEDELSPFDYHSASLYVY